MMTSPSDPHEWEDWPPSEDEAERQFQRVGPFLYVPLELPADDIPEALEDQ